LDGQNSLFTIGKVSGVHGLKGYLKIVSFAESISTFAPGTQLLVRDSDSKGTWYSVVRASSHKKGLLLLLDGVDRDAAEDLVGKEVLVNRDELPQLDDHSYYWEDLVGLDVVDIRSGWLGKIVSVIATGSNDVFVVKGGKREVMVPALSWVVLHVDIENNTMKIDLPEGL